MLYNNLYISTLRATIIRILFILMYNFKFLVKTYEREADNVHIKKLAHFKHIGKSISLHT